MKELKILARWFAFFICLAGSLTVTYYGLLIVCGVYKKFSFLSIDPLTWKPHLWYYIVAAAIVIILARICVQYFMNFSWLYSVPTAIVTLVLIFAKGNDPFQTLGAMILIACMPLVLITDILCWKDPDSRKVFPGFLAAFLGSAWIVLTTYYLFLC